MTLRPNQRFALDETERLTAAGVRHWCVTSPTGAGKSRWMIEEMDRAARNGLRVDLITHRKTVLSQFIAELEYRQIPFGTRSSSHDKQYANDNALVQLVMPLTEAARVKRGQRPTKQEADLLLVDEAHGMLTGATRELINSYENARKIEVTATPVGLHKFCSQLVVAGTNSEMRRIGAILPAKVYDPGCPNLRNIRRVSNNEFNVRELKDSGYIQQIHASVFDEADRRNPDRRAMIIFAPCVASSKWLVDQGKRRGYDLVHIDGSTVYRDGKIYTSSNAAREDAIGDIQSGRCHGLSNRFVAREGINIPELFYCAVACPMGALTSYVQSVGRVLRSCGDMDHVIVADHGGNARRLGSPNTDWDWKSMWRLTHSQIEQERTRQVEQGLKDVGTACPGCGRMYAKLPDRCECGQSLAKEYSCPKCGHEHREWPHGHECQSCGEDMRAIRRKPILQADGCLAYVRDETFREKPTMTLGKQTQKLWDGIFWGSRKYKPNRTFGQLKGTFIWRHLKEFQCRPPLDLARMPLTEEGWRKRVGETPFSELRGE